MTSCRSHQRSISGWIFSLARWCLWTITPRWNYTWMYRIECEIKWILCFTWNYSMGFPTLPGSEAGNMRDHRASVLRISWNCHITKTRTMFSLAINPKYGWFGTWEVLALKLSLSKLEKIWSTHVEDWLKRPKNLLQNLNSLSGCNAEFQFIHLFNSERRVEVTLGVRKQTVVSRWHPWMGTALLPGKWVLLLSPSFFHLGIILVLLNWNMGSKLSWISGCS